MPSLTLIILLLFASVGAITAQQDSTAGAVPLTKNPTTAVLYSLAFPGVGQLYTEQYWKVPIFAGAAVTTAVLMVHNHSQYADLDRQVDAALLAGDNAIVVDRLRRSRDVFRQNRDVSGALLLATYLIAAVDAYVGAHLYDFNVDESLSLRLSPTPTAPLSLAMQIRL